MIRPVMHACPAISQFSTKFWVGLFLSFTLLTMPFAQDFAVSAADLRLDSPYVLRDRALQTTLKHSQHPDDIQHVLDLYKVAIDRSEKDYGADSTYTAQLYFELGSYALDNAKFTVALENLNRAVELDPNAISPRLKLIKLHELRKEPTLARQQVMLLLAKHPDSREGRQMLVNEMQKSDPAAATRQAFRIDKLLLAGVVPPAGINSHSAVPDKNNKSSATASGATKLVSSTPTSTTAPAQPPGLAGKPIAVQPIDNTLTDTKPNVLPAQTVISAMSLRILQKSAPAPPAQQPAAAVVPEPAVVKPQTPVSPNAAPNTSKEAKQQSSHQKAKTTTRAKKPHASVPRSGPESMLEPALEPNHAQKPAHNGSKGKSSTKIPKGGLVPAPPPLPFVPVYPGMMPISPPRSQSGAASVQLRTDAKIQNAKKGGQSGGGAKGESVEGKGEAKSESAKPTDTTSGASKSSSDTDPDFLLKWASISQKKKGKGSKDTSAKEDAAAKELPAKNVSDKTSDKPSGKDDKDVSPKETKQSKDDN